MYPFHDQVEIQTPTSSATSYFLVPRVHPLQASLTVQPKQVRKWCRLTQCKVQVTSSCPQVTADGELSVTWSVPQATPGDTIGMHIALTTVGRCKLIYILLSWVAMTIVKWIVLGCYDNSKVDCCRVAMTIVKWIVVVKWPHALLGHQQEYSH